MILANICQMCIMKLKIRKTYCERKRLTYDNIRTQEENRT